jgi:O-antigen/teichoic acid export membrane protein
MPPPDQPLRPEKKPKKGKKTYGKTAKLGALWSVARQLIRHGIGVPASMVMARLLSPAEFGVAAAASFFLTLTSRITELGLNQALVRVKVLRPEHKSSVFMVSLGFGVLTWLGLMLAAPFIGHFFRSADVTKVVSVTAWGFLITPFSTVPSALLQRDMRFKAMSFIDWLDVVIGAVVAIVLAWMGWSYWSLVYGQLTANSVTVITKMSFARWVPNFRISRAALNELWSFGVGIQIKRVLEFGAQNLDNLLIGKTIGIAALGLYDKAFMTTQRLQQTLNLGPAVSFRIFAILQDDAARFLRAYRKVLLTIGVVSVPPLAVCAATAPQLFAVMYGSKWMAAVPAFQILCLATTIKLTSAHATRANEAQGLIWRQVLQHVGYVLLIAVGVWIGSRWGITGAACGVVVARFTLAVLIHNLLRRTLGATWGQMIGPALPGVTLAVAMGGIALATELVLRQFVPTVSPLALLSTQGVVAVLAYVPCVVYSPFQDLRAIVRETVEDFAPRFASWVPAPAALPEVNLTKAG